MNINAVKREADVPCSSLSLSSLITSFYPILSSPVDMQQELLLMGSLSIFLSAKNWEWEGSMTQDLWKKSQHQATTVCSSTLSHPLFTPPFPRSSHCKLIMFPNTTGHRLPTASGAATCWGCSARRQLFPSLWFTAYFLPFSWRAEVPRVGVANHTHFHLVTSLLVV